MTCLHGEFTECPHNWHKVKDPREMLPTGWPIVVRIGNGGWRLVPRKGKTGWDGFPAMETIMIPEDGQTTEVWSEVWK